MAIFDIQDGVLVKIKKPDNVIIVPEDVTTIGENVFDFSDCPWDSHSSAVLEIRISKGVRKICDNAFSHCRNLQEIFLPNTVTEIGSEIFLGCKWIEKIEVEEGNPVYFSENNCLIERSTKTLIVGCKNSAIPNGVTIIGHAAFKDCEISHLVLPKSIKEIRDEAFLRSKLQNITIPEGVTTIGNRAFQDCYDLKSISIPSTVASIGSDILRYCMNLTSIRVAENNPNYLSLENCLIERKTHALICGVGKCAIPIGITKIGDGAFYGNKELREINIPDSVTEIGNCAFYDCKNLREVFIPSSVRVIAGGAFAGCKGRFVIEDGVTKIGGGAFSGCSFEDFKIPTTVTEIGAHAFHYCSHLKEIVLPRGLKIIANATFAECPTLESVIISEGVMKIKQRAFAGCRHLESITLPNTLKVLGNIVFRGCCLLKELTIPNSVTKIGRNLLRLTNLHTLTLPRRFESVISTLGVDTNKTKIIYTEDSFAL